MKPPLRKETAPKGPGATGKPLVGPQAETSIRPLE